MLALDAAAFHKTPTILEILRSSSISIAFVPPGCTGILQPLDTAVNKPFKEILREQTEIYTDKLEEAGEAPEKWSVSQKRVMVTHVVSESWKQFCQEKKALIAKAFQDVGLSLSIDSSEDSLLSIKGYNHGEPIIGDWRRADELEDIQDFQEIASTGMAEEAEYRLESEACITQNYKGMLVSQLREVMIDRQIKGRSKALKRADMVALLVKNDEEL